MDIKNKLYPYPVLAGYLDDYKNSKFETNIDMEKEGYDIKVTFYTELTNIELKNMIKDKTVSFVYHIECAQTGFRKVHITDLYEDQYILSDKEVRGKIQICPFIVANKDIKAYKSDDFHDDYNGESFYIETGCVMAVGTMVVADIVKESDDLSKTPSIFSIIKNADLQCRQMLVDYSDRKIIIKLPEEEYYSYKTLIENPAAYSMLNSLTVMPALVYVLSEMRRIKIESENDFAELSENLWFKTLSKSLKKKFDIDIESSDFDNINSIELAQKLLHDPLADSFNILVNSFEGNGGDDK